MSDYTPTTEEVRNAYGVLRNSYKIQRFDQEFDRGFMSEFDRWLAEIKRKEREAERQQILNLIEEDICSACKDDPGVYEHPFTGLCCRDAHGVIALIKGEEQ